MKFSNVFPFSGQSVLTGLLSLSVSLPLMTGCGANGAGNDEAVAQPRQAGMAAATVATAVSTLTAPSCQFSAVQATAAGAAIGQTVVIPAGNCDWGANQLTVTAGITVKGAGRDATILRRTADVPVNTYLIKFDCTNGAQAKFSDMTLMGANMPDTQDRGLGLIGGCVDFVVYNAKFTQFVFAGIEIRGLARQRGVIYNSQFINNFNSTVNNLGYGIVVFGDGTWPALQLGSANAVYVEDNYMFGNRHQIAANNGAQYVFRHNVAIATDLTKNFPQVDAHGLSSSDRGTRSWEVYNNTFSAQLSAGNRAYAGVGMRGGDGVVFNNTYGSNILTPVSLILEDEPCGTYPVLDQIRQAYISETATTTSQCSLSIAKNRDYFLTTRPGYTPYTYPHPLRATSS